MSNGISSLRLMFLLGGIALPVASWSQVKNTKPAPKTPIASKFAQTAFSPTIVAVPIGYVGHDVEGIYKWVMSRPKGANIAANQTIYGQIKVGSTLAFAQKIEKESTYDTAKEVYDVQINLEPMFDSQNGLELMNWRRLKFNDNLVEQTTYSTPKIKTVLKSVSIEHDLLLAGWGNFPLERGKFGYDARAHYPLQMSNAEANAAKNNISALYIYSLKAPYTSQKERRVIPEPEFPMDNLTRYSNLHGDLLQIWLYNAKTGKIYQKLVPTPTVTVDDKFDQAEFYPYSTVSTSYVGHDTKTIYQIIEKHPKGTSFQENQPLYGQLKLGSTLAFAKKVEGPILYTASTGVVRVKLLTDIQINQPNGLDDLNRRRIVVDSKLVSQSEYALPDIPKVFKTVMSEDNLALDGWDKMPLEYESQTPYAVLPLTKEEAQAAVNRLSALYIYKLKAPYILKTVTTSKPTAISPTEGEFTYKSLRGDIKEVWFYNNRTGKVYRKIVAPEG